MKKLFFTVSLCIASVVLICCNGSKANNETPSTVSNVTETSTELDTNLDKYLGLYVFGNNFGSYSIGKFPENTKVKSAVGSNYMPIDKKFIGKYFLVNDKFSYETTKVAEYAGGYIAPQTGEIIVGVAQDGSITIQHYDNYGKTGAIMDFNVGEAQVYGKFISRADGKYNLSLNNAIYELK
ncbi:MAG: hypothetical protein ACJ77K_03280 [Bacteroidia bacterium]